MSTPCPWKIAAPRSLYDGGSVDNNQKSVELAGASDSPY